MSAGRRLPALLFCAVVIPGRERSERTRNPVPEKVLASGFRVRAVPHPGMTAETVDAYRRMEKRSPGSGETGPVAERAGESGGLSAAPRPTLHMATRERRKQVMRHFARDTQDAFRPWNSAS
jgi:hypothetical protein